MEKSQKHKTIELSRGRVALVDPEDYEMVNQFKWHCLANNYAAHKFYLGKKNGKWIKAYLRMHQLVMGVANVEIDHIDGNRLNNQKSNLRFCNRTLNNGNSKQKITNKSGYKGVSWSKAAHKWVAQVKAYGKGGYLGVFTTKEEAARAYNKKAVELFGEFARVNQL